MNPTFLWWLSCEAYKKNIPFIPFVLKTINFLVFHAVLPYQAEVEKDVLLAHYGLGIIVHTNVKVGHRVEIYNHVTLAAMTWYGSEHKILIEDDVIIGSGAKVIGRGNKSLTIGKGARIGANAVVTGDVMPGQTVVGVPARPLSERSV